MEQMVRKSGPPAKIRLSVAFAEHDGKPQGRGGAIHGDFMRVRGNITPNLLVAFNLPVPPLANAGHGGHLLLTPLQNKSIIVGLSQ